jgi:hypothetical protein
MIVGKHSLSSTIGISRNQLQTIKTSQTSDFQTESVLIEYILLVDYP